MIKEKITKLIAEHKIILFMKGDRFLPRCGFSAQVVEILDRHKVKYTTYDILEDEELRQALKDFSKWPTYPQLYVNGEFIGGCDIVTEMDENGELSSLF